MLASSDEKQLLTKMQVLLDKTTDEFWVIGISRPPATYYPFHKRLANLPDTWTDGWIWGVLKITRPEQWYIQE